MIVLASRSPQRRGLLRGQDIEHRVVLSDYAEDDIPGATADELVLAHARGKARDVAGRGGIPAGGAVLGSDTTVAIDDYILGKPRDRGDAAAMLNRLSGRTHVVATGVCLITGTAERSFVETANVTFRAISAEHREWYLDRGEWQGRAGAYAIQGAGVGLVRRIDGDPTTVVGLPIAALLDALGSLGLTPWDAEGAPAGPN